MEKIELGDTVKCKYTGFKGIAVSKTEFINGCIQFAVAPKWDSKHPECDTDIDSQSLEIVKKKIKEVEKEEFTGGASTKHFKRRGY